MSIGDFFKGLLLDAWYKAFVYIGGIVLVLSFFIDAKGISNIHLQQIAGGIFLIGIGEWKNHQEDFSIKPPNAYTGPAMLITQTVWRPDIIGLILDLAGAVLFFAGICGAMRPTVSVTPVTATPSPLPAAISTATSTATPLPLSTATAVPVTTPTSLKFSSTSAALIIQEKTLSRRKIFAKQRLDLHPPPLLIPVFRYS